MNFRLVDATELVDPAEPILRNRRGYSAVVPMGSVHLAPEAYQELEDAVATAGYTDESDSASESASTASTVGQNRKRPELVITVPRLPAAKRGKITPDVRPADWQLGRADGPSGTAHSHGRYYWHGSGSGSRGRAPGGWRNRSGCRLWQRREEG
jgi:hypothetical protein